MTTTFLVLYACTIAAAQLALFTGRITNLQYNGLMAVLCTVSGVVAACNGWTTTIYTSAGCGAWCAWRWWNGGGGDGTKRRLRRWGRRFQGVRRTAPQGA